MYLEQTLEGKKAELVLFKKKCRKLVRDIKVLEELIAEQNTEYHVEGSVKTSPFGDTPDSA